jgi:hypothetical protein
MASEILGLFASPELYTQQQDALRRQQAMQYAQLDPYERATYGANLAGQRFGGGLGRVLGGSDPQLQIISARRQAMENVDPSNPESILQAAQQLSSIGDQQGALALADYARKAQSEQALQQQRMREGRAASTPKELQIARERAAARGLQPDTEAYNTFIDAELARQTTKEVKEDLTNEIKNARAVAAAEGLLPGTPQYEQRVGQLVTQYTIKPEKDVRFGVDREAIAEEVYGKPFAQLSQTEKAAVNKRVEEEQNRKAKSSSPTLTILGQGKEGAKDIPAFRDKVIGTIDPFRKTVTAADSAITNIRDSIKTSNFASFRAAQTQFARAISGAGDLSQKELKAAGADPSLIGGTADYLSTLFTSTPTADTQKKLLSTLKAIRTVAAKKAKEEISNQKKIATRAGYTEDDTALIFNFPEFESGAAPSADKKTTTRTLKSGKVVTITED